MTSVDLIEKYKQRITDLYTAPELVDLLSITIEELLVTFDDKVVDYIKNVMDEGDDRIVEDSEGPLNAEVDE